MRLARITIVAAVALLALAMPAMPVMAADTIKVALIEGVSGHFAETGAYAQKSFQGIIDKVNGRGGVLGKKLELVVMDSKGSPQEALVQLQKCADLGIRFVTQGNGSNVAAALIDGVNKLYQRSPEKAILFLNYAAVAPELTGEKASFFHFRFDPNADMRMLAIIRSLANNKSVKKVYLIGQDYAHGRTVSAAAKRFLKQIRPDVKIVGDELHPMGRVKDFSPYIAKIKASGADTVITGNWGNDMVLLVKSGNDSGLKVNWYTFYGGSAGAAKAIGEPGVGRFYEVYPDTLNSGSRGSAEYRKFEVKYDTVFQYVSSWTEIEMLVKAIGQAKSTDPVKVAKALEGMTYLSGNGEVWMRPDDHQLMAPMYVSVLQPAGPGKKVRYESTPGSGYGWQTSYLARMQDLVLAPTARIDAPK